MKTETSFSHACGESNYHLVFCPKYRHAIFNDADLKKACECSLIETADKYGVILRAMRVCGDHIHLFVALKPDQSVSWAMHKFKGRSAHELFEAFPWLKEWKVWKMRFWGGHLWSPGYFFRSVGSTTNEAVDFYIKISQDKSMREKYYSMVGSPHEDTYVTFIKKQMEDPQMSLADYT